MHREQEGQQETENTEQEMEEDSRKESYWGSILVVDGWIELFYYYITCLFFHPV